MTADRRLLIQSATVAVLVLAWQLAAVLADHPYFPPPSEIVAAAGRMWFSGPAADAFLTADARDNVLASIGRMLGGWGIAVLAGVLAGVMCGLSRTALTCVGPLLSFFRALPLPALAPVFLLICQLGTPMVLTVVASGAVWAVLLSTVDGVRSVHRTQVETALVFQVSWLNRLLWVVLPAALPKILAGLRVSLSQALLLTAVAELFAANGGLGEQLRDARDKFDFAGMWAVVALLGLLGCLFNAVLLMIERIALARHGRRERLVVKKATLI